VFHNVKLIGEWLLFVNTMFLDLNGHWFILFGPRLNGFQIQQGKQDLQDCQDFFVETTGSHPLPFFSHPR